MPVKFELVMSVWDDGLFAYRVRTEADNIDESIRLLIDGIKKVQAQIAEKEAARRKIWEDDDIPF